MVIKALDALGCSWEADVVEAGKAGTADIFDVMIGHEEMLLPSHEDKIAWRQLLIVEIVRIEVFGITGRKLGKFGPMLSVDFFVRIPLSG